MANEGDHLPFGVLLREFRVAAGLSQQALAECAQMSTIGVGALERGTGVRRIAERSPCSRNMAAYLVALGRWDEARTHAREALGLAREDQGGTTLWSLQHLAAVAALRPVEDAGRVGIARRHTAEVLGFVEGRLPKVDTIREHTEQQQFERVCATLRDAIGENEFAVMMGVGAVMTEDEAIQIAFAI